MSEKLYEAYHINVSQPTISRKLAKMKLTRKRQTLVPQEKNTTERIEEREFMQWKCPDFLTKTSYY